MEYNEAAKLYQAMKPADNFLVIKLGYDFKLVLPYKAGLAFLDSLTNAEQLHDPYNEQHRICSMDSTRVVANVMSRKEYREYKIAALMGIKVEEVKQHQLIKETA